MGRPRLYESGIYLKLTDQGLIEPIVVWKDVDTTIKGISTKVDFEIIDPKEGSSSFPASQEAVQFLALYNLSRII